MASRPRALRAPTGTAANPARRNLFHGHHLARRPTGASTATGAANASGSNTIPEMRYDDSSDIFMREPNGEPQVQMPQLVPMDDDEAAGGNAEGLQGEKERLEERLIETYKSRSFAHGDKIGMPSVVNHHVPLAAHNIRELVSAVQASLRRQVAALDEDNWMFEAEEAQAG
ncbi:MAG: hypothetical protein L6R39_005202 [Caloplaca ligustica]|nr:MAG: hypothetical protein L6R39_005202 [Caloplaca ligustica]